MLGVRYENRHYGRHIEEVSQLKTAMNVHSSKIIGQREYYSGMLYGINTTLVFSRWGKVASASTATTLINQFNVDYIIFTGVAGAVSATLNIGDIVIATEVYQHDMDPRPIFKKHEVPLLGKSTFSTDKALTHQTTQAAQAFLSNDLAKIITDKTLARFSIHKPAVYCGTIASGDQFVSDPKIVAELLREMPNTLAVEMEGGSVGQVCFEHNIPFVVIRTISDKADHSAVIDFQKFIAEISTHYSQGIIENLFQFQRGRSG